MDFMIQDRDFMKVNMFYLLKVWLTATFFIALACACWPDLRTYPLIMLPKTLAYSVGIFFGVIVRQLEYSLDIFICLYLLFYLLTRKFFLSERLVKSLLFVFFLTGVFIANRIYFPWKWFHPFFIVYSAGAAIAFYLFDVYRLDLEFDD
jgi:hypothetical protein